jgi:hypothetical protein
MKDKRVSGVGLGNPVCLAGWKKLCSQFPLRLISQIEGIRATESDDILSKIMFVEAAIFGSFAGVRMPRIYGGEIRAISPRSAYAKTDDEKVNLLQDAMIGRPKTLT